jgi:hypothetical protein
MALITGSRSNIAHAESYADVAEFQEYCGLIGYSITGKSENEIEQALRRGTRWIDATYGPRFIGAPATAEQALEWPRTGAVWRGSEFPSDHVPQKVRDAACEAAWREWSDPGSLSPDKERGGRVKRKRERVEGAVEEETEWMDGAPAETAFSAIDGLLNGLIRSKGSPLFGSAARA